MPLRLAPAAGDGRRYAERLLERNGLPTADLDSPAVRLYVAHDGDRPVGCGGLQPLGDAGVGLLRSVVVERPARGQRFGAAVCDALETEAAAVGVERLYRSARRVPRGSAPRVKPTRGFTFTMLGDDTSAGTS